MVDIMQVSTHWRATCQFPKYMVDYRDYMRGKFESFKILNFKGNKVCKDIEYIDIRGHTGQNVTVVFWQNDAMMLHTDSNKRRCTFTASSGSANSEDNFGYYKSTNQLFRCTESSTATTQYWFGGQV